MEVFRHKLHQLLAKPVDRFGLPIELERPEVCTAPLWWHISYLEAEPHFNAEPIFTCPQVPATLCTICMISSYELPEWDS